MDYLYSLQVARETLPQWVNYIFLVISEFISVGGVLIPSGIYWCLSKRAGSYVMSAFTGGYLVNQVVKNTACIYRPWVVDSRLHVAELAKSTATGYSFPSGHSLSASTIYGGAAIYKNENKKFVLFMAIMIVLTAFSRNWLGAHTLKDVLFAIVEGMVVLLINAIAINAMTGKTDSQEELHPKRDMVFFAIGIIFTGVAIIYLGLKSYPIEYDQAGNILADPYEMLTDCYRGAGMFSGFLFGWIIERRFINFSIEGEKKEKIKRFALGTITLIIVYLVILPLLVKPLDEHTARFVKYFFVFLYIMAGYPFIIKKMQNKKQNNK